MIGIKYLNLADKLQFNDYLFFAELYKDPKAKDITILHTAIPALSILPINNNIPPTKVNIINIICKSK